MDPSLYLEYIAIATFRIHATLELLFIAFIIFGAIHVAPTLIRLYREIAWHLQQPKRQGRLPVPPAEWPRP